MQPPDLKPGYRQILFGSKDSKGIIWPNVKSLFAAEAVSSAAAYGFLQGLYRFFPDAMQNFKNWTARVIIEPNLRWLQPLIGKKKPEGEAPTVASIAQDKKDVEFLASVMVETAISAPISTVLAKHTHKLIDPVVGLTPNSDRAYYGIHIVNAVSHAGAFCLMNGRGSDSIEKLRLTFKSAMQKIGFSETTAEKATQYFKTVEGPNLVGAIAALATTIGINAYTTRQAGFSRA